MQTTNQIVTFITSPTTTRTKTFFFFGGQTRTKTSILPCLGNQGHQVEHGKREHAGDDRSRESRELGGPPK